MSLFVEGADEPTRVLAPGQELAPFEMRESLNIIRNPDEFPFDKYEGELQARASRTAEAKPLAIPVVIIPDTSGIPGYHFTNTAPTGFQQTVGLATGTWIVETSIVRSTDTQISALLVGLLMLTSAIGAFAMGALVFIGRRPVASGSFLAFAAIFPFSLIALRTAIPDLPHSDVLFDIYVFYPSVTLSFLVLIGGMARWLATPEAD